MGIKLQDEGRWAVANGKQCLCPFDGLLQREEPGRPHEVAPHRNQGLLILTLADFPFWLADACVLVVDNAILNFLSAAVFSGVQHWRIADGPK